MAIIDLKKQHHKLSSRELALTILLLLDNNTSIQSLLNKKLLEYDLTNQNSRLVTELVYGYLRAELRISWLLTQFLKKPKKLPTIMLTILGIAIYELLFLDYIPSYASIYTAVMSIESRFGKKLGGVANATLRAIIQQTKQIDTPTESIYYKRRIKDEIEYLSVFYSIPMWIITLWVNSYGTKKTKMLAKASFQRPWRCIRINQTYNGWKTLHSLFYQYGGLPVGLSGICFKPNRNPISLEAYLNHGYISIQGAGSQLVLEALALHKCKTPIWDACAGRGGKTLSLLECGVPILAASDVSFSRLKGLKNEAQRLALPTPPIFCGSTTRSSLSKTISRIQSYLDGQSYSILLDVPCSGLGTLSRHPDIKKFRTEAQVKQLIELQQKLISSAWNQLPVNGNLIYITCTTNPAENELQLSSLLTAYPQATVKKQWENTPDSIGTDIMFGAIIQKTSN